MTTHQRQRKGSIQRSRICGVHAVQAALDQHPERMEQLWLDQARQDSRMRALIEQAGPLGLVPQYVPKETLDRLVPGATHQGVVLQYRLPPVRGENALYPLLEKLQAPPLLLILDCLQDPHNLGACLRSAEATGVDAVIVPSNRAVSLNPTVCKVASGAAELVPFFQVGNLARFLKKLKALGIWVVGAVGQGAQLYYKADMKMPLALVVGAEQKGLRRLTQEGCDVLVQIPMAGKISSLNVSVATGVLLYEVVRQRAVA